MKIAILTQPLYFNYGGLLQNYALQQTLILMGHEVETLSLLQTPKPCSHYLEWRTFAVTIAHFLLGHIKIKDVLLPYNTKKKCERVIVNQFLENFTSKYINYSPSLDTLGQIQDYCNQKGFDAYIVGSDQTWRPSYSLGKIDWMFLSFLSNESKAKRIAYASSFGTSKWEYTPSQESLCKPFAKRFDAISVRETSGIDLCRFHLGVNAACVLDPTMLLTSADYQKIVKAYYPKETVTPKRYKVFAYILDKEPAKIAIINHAAAKLNAETEILTCILQFKQFMNEAEVLKIQPKPVPYWLRNFDEADFIITDSFHGTVFSILHHKPFYVIGNTKRGNARMETLLSIFELQDRLIEVGSSQNIDYDLKAINWTKVENILNAKREEAFAFLSNALL